MGKRRSRRRPCEKPGGSQRRLARNHIAIQEQEHGQAQRSPCEKPGGSQRRLARYHIVMKMQEHGQAAKPSQAMRPNSKERFPPPEKIIL